MFYFLHKKKINKNKDCSVSRTSGVSEKSPAGVGFLPLTPFVLAPFRESLFSKITEDPRPITPRTEHCKEVTGGGWNIL